MTTYRIKDWDKHFENNRTRELKRLDWVPIPNKQDGDGYTELMDHPNCAAHLGAWYAIVEVASKCEPRGTLVRAIPQEGAVIPQEGAQGILGSKITGKPHTPQSLARMSRIPATIFEEVIPRLVSIGWLEVCEIPQEGAAIPQEGASSRARAQGMEWNGIEDKSTPTPRNARAEKTPEEKPTNHPTEEQAKKYFTDIGADFTPEEIHSCFIGFEAGKTQAGYWQWGKALVGDWRSAMEIRMLDDRHKHSTPANTAVSSPVNGKPSAFALSKQLDAIEAELKEIENRTPRDALQTWMWKSDKDKNRFRELRVKRKEVQQKLQNVT